MATETTDKVKDYYGKRVQCQDDLQTQACIADDTVLPKYIKQILSQVHDEVMARYYGCGLTIPTKVEGMKVLDLGSGSGRDCFVVSKLVGQDGHVTGIDMTKEQLDVARKHIPYHMEKFGYKQLNVEFLEGYIEKIRDAGVKENSQDIIISNCVVNLSPDKKAVISEAYKVLKEGGEFYFSDMYCDRELTEEVRKHEVLWGECFSGCLTWTDLYAIASEVGFAPARFVSTSPIGVDREDFKKVLGDAKFVSTEYRLFKLPKERVGPKQVVYKGSITGCEKELVFDHQTIFKGNTGVASAGQSSVGSCEIASLCGDGELNVEPVSYLGHKGNTGVASAGQSSVGSCEIASLCGDGELNVEPVSYLGHKTGEAVDVDSELATILSCSRYKDDFDIKPSSKTDITAPNHKIDPFANIEERIKKGEKFAAACCGGGEKKEVEKKAGGCCGGGEKKEVEENKAGSGCGGAKKCC